MHSIGIIGYGAFGRFLKQSWEALPNARVQFITKTQPETARKMAEEDGIASYSADYHDLIADPDIDVVVIATPPYLHEKMAVEALRAGKNVLVEKPLAMSPAECESIIRATEESGKVTTVNFLMRYSGLVEKLRALCREGLLGGLRRVIIENYAGDEGLKPDHWFWDRAKSGGIFIEHGVHFFDLVHWVTGGEASKVAGFATERSPGIQDKVLASVRYDNGIMATFYHAFSRPSALERQVATYMFDRGQVIVFGWIPIELHLSGFVSGSEAQRLKELFPDPTLSPPEWSSIESSGIDYRVAHEVQSRYVQSEDKQQEYANCARLLMSDLIASIDDPSRQMRITLADGLRSVRIAYAAASDAL